ncbi:protein-L-isoaspartate O-methyltransferase [Candidatus Saccharibacteria bacterium]|jgi:protein-L-isoaspartate(D-aspartate) O-methyltransferase|nr:protein-L-isoaspartate O-methyltransferase [Candidatus Saccharibacteria bacterium]
MDRVQEALNSVPRENFLPAYAKGQHVDVPLPIGFGQTNSQPTTVRMMLEWLEVEKGDTVLDVGSGSGWTTALLSHLVGPSGKVCAVELIPELVEFGRDNCQRFGVRNAKFHQAGEAFGLPKYAPYDRILVSASARELPDELLDQIKVGGKMVIPVGRDILEIEKLSEDNYETRTHHGFVFVPLIKG